MKIPNKRTFYNLAMRGLCGNTPRMWWSYQDFLHDGAPFDTLGVRCLRAGDSRFKAFVPQNEVETYLREVHLFPGEYILSETLPVGNHKIQGELSYIAGRFCFYHSYVQKPMRAALAESGMHAFGWDALQLLRFYAAPADVEDIMQLLDDCSGGGTVETCAEITVSTVPFGIFPRRSIIVWELRQY